MTFQLKAQAPTGLTITARIRRDADGYVYDDDDDTFKDGSVSGALTDPDVNMPEPDSTNFAGLYQSASIDPSTWDDGLYTVLLTESAGDETFDPLELEVRDGELQKPGDDMKVEGIVRLASSSGNLEFLAWLLRNGRIYESPTSASITVYKSDGTTFITALSDTTPDAQGVFKVEKTSAGATVDTAYYAVATITAGGVTYKGPIAFVVY